MAENGGTMVEDLKYRSVLDETWYKGVFDVAVLEYRMIETNLATYYNLERTQSDFRKARLLLLIPST